ncbi:hypothetical protein RM574_25590 [Streptomyces sp. DSM 41982]|uniref:Uncharacterized protein n=1 Tax=Streptomyces evansiae TaxID=3075535 RepID=A0ABD5EDY4_9ACTN|nr:MULTISPECIES: hypothetical protein [unclassified Streptomyces]MDT0418858.1 hypothetical protein [Streptomyces sp. DSM 41982]SCD62372.1 hypothetical protein GA0115246_1038910 [Streptomyces sp. SolWspMP-sol7th]
MSAEADAAREAAEREAEARRALEAKEAEVAAHLAELARQSGKG